jgi:hypothetical protein
MKSIDYAGGMVLLIIGLYLTSERSNMFYFLFGALCIGVAVFFITRRGELPL